MNWRKATKGAVIAAVLIGCVVAVMRWWKTDDPAAEEGMTEVTIAAAKYGPLRQTVDCTGRVVSNLDVDIKCRASGETVKLPFDVSDHVQKGDLLLELDPADQERMLKQSEAALSASRARLAQAEATLRVATKSIEADKQKASAAVEAATARTADAGAKAKREEQLVEKKFSSKELLETAQTYAVQAEQDLKTAQAQIGSLEAAELDLETKRQQINLAKAEVDSDTIALELAKRQLGYTSVFAPMEGYISARNVQIGTIISSGISNIGGGTTVLVLSDLSHIYILGSVDEANIGFVAMGQSAEITADAYPEKRFAGTVNRIATKGVNLQNVVKFEVRIEVTSEDKILLKPEMTANVTIVASDKPNVLQIPSDAVSRNREGTFVTLKGAEGEPGEARQVVTGITDGGQIEIVSGLQENEEVLVQSPEAESRWRAGNQGPGQGQSNMRQRMMMMRTMGGGRPH